MHEVVDAGRHVREVDVLAVEECRVAVGVAERRPLDTALPPDGTACSRRGRRDAVRARAGRCAPVVGETEAALAVAISMRRRACGARKSRTASDASGGGGASSCSGTRRHSGSPRTCRLRAGRAASGHPRCAGRRTPTSMELAGPRLSTSDVKPSTPGARRAGDQSPRARAGRSRGAASRTLSAGCQAGCRPRWYRLPAT